MLRARGGVFAAAESPGFKGLRTCKAPAKMPRSPLLPRGRARQALASALHPAARSERPSSGGPGAARKGKRRSEGGAREPKRVSVTPAAKCFFFCALCATRKVPRAGRSMSTHVCMYIYRIAKCGGAEMGEREGGRRTEEEEGESKLKEGGKTAVSFWRRRRRRGRRRGARVFAPPPLLKETLAHTTNTRSWPDCRLVDALLPSLDQQLLLLLSLLRLETLSKSEQKKLNGILPLKRGPPLPRALPAGMPPPPLHHHPLASVPAPGRAVGISVDPISLGACHELAGDARSRVFAARRSPPNADTPTQPPQKSLSTLKTPKQQHQQTRARRPGCLSSCARSASSRPSARHRAIAQGEGLAAVTATTMATAATTTATMARPRSFTARTRGRCAWWRGGR